MYVNYIICRKIVMHERAKKGGTHDASVTTFVRVLPQVSGHRCNTLFFAKIEIYYNSVVFSKSVSRVMHHFKRAWNSAA